MKRICQWLPLLLCVVTMTSCHRSSRVMWEDSKTAGRYLRRGFDSFLGRHVDEQPFAFNEGSRNSSEMDYMPLVAEDDSYVSSEYLPPSNETPGENGSAIPGIEGFSTPSGYLAELFNKIHFETDQYTVTGGENLRVLNEIASYLSQHPNVYVFVEGHADERGAAAYNLSLGAKRSNSVRSMLAEKGIDPNRLFTISYGKERPVVFGHDEIAWNQNRRAEFKIYEK